MKPLKPDRTPHDFLSTKSFIAVIVVAVILVIAGTVLNGQNSIKGNFATQITHNSFPQTTLTITDGTSVIGYLTLKRNRWTYTTVAPGHYQNTMKNGVIAGNKLEFPSGDLFAVLTFSTGDAHILTPWAEQYTGK